MQPFSIDFSRGNISQTARGWVCRVWFKVETAAQFTEETHQAHGSSRWRWLAYWRAMRAARILHNRLAAKPSDRAAVGWGG